MTKIDELKEGMLHLMFPELCFGCRTPLHSAETLLCLSCFQELTRTEFHHKEDNAASQRLGGRIPFEHASAFAWFSDDSLLQHLLHELKYRNKKQVGIALGKFIAEDLSDCHWISHIQVIIPVPLHIKKERLRGYNQSALIAQGLGDHLNIPVATSDLRRNRHTESQVNKTREERTANMRDAFSVKGNTLKDKHILLIDDVLTTGATLEAAAAALLKIPGVKISILTAGIAQD